MWIWVLSYLNVYSKYGLNFQTKIHNIITISLTHLQLYKGIAHILCVFQINIPILSFLYQRINQ